MHHRHVHVGLFAAQVREHGHAVAVGDDLFDGEGFVGLRLRALFHATQQRFAIAGEPGVVVAEVVGHVAGVGVLHAAAGAQGQEVFRDAGVIGC